MGIALGQEPPVGLYIAGRLHTGYYDDIPDVSVDPDDIETLWDDEFGPEKFIDLSERVDVLVMDPNFLTGRADWSGDAIERIKSTGTPFFGNSITSRGYSWHQDYDYLTMYEAFEKLAEVFQERNATTSSRRCTTSSSRNSRTSFPRAADLRPRSCTRR